MAKKYLSKINKGGYTIHLKDAEAREAVQQEASRAASAESTLAAGTLYTVNMDSITPSSTFVKNAVLGINGVIYRAKNATSSLPVTLVIQNGAYVYHEINGHKAYVVADWTLNANWEVWTDSSMEYWRESFDQALDTKLSMDSTLEYNSTTYTVRQLLEKVASLM